MSNLDEQARAILARNDRGGYTVPTAALYPHQWNWDSAFTAWGYATFDIDRAWRELETLFAGQWENGMVPHIIFHGEQSDYFPGPKVWGTSQSPPTSGISQPPVAATFARHLFETCPQAGRPRLADLYPRILAWHRWWRRERCRSGIVAVTHPWESGRDNSMEWDCGMDKVDISGVSAYRRGDTAHVDISMRPATLDYDRFLAIVDFGRNCGWNQTEILENGPFLMADPATTFILIRANRDLAALARALGEDPSEAERWAAELEAALPLLWNDELKCYDALNLRTQEFSNTIGLGAFLAWLAGIECPQVAAKLMATWNGVRYGIPSSCPQTPGFDAQRYWRGPSWPFMNALIALGLRDIGRAAEAERLRSETAELIARGGFYEYFNPMNGQPCGGGSFSFTAAVWLAWAGR